MKTTFYVRFEPRFRGSRLVSLRAATVTQKRPLVGRTGYVVGFTVDVDDRAFAVPMVSADIGVDDVTVVAEVETPDSDTVR